MIKGFFLQIQFLTRIPLPVKIDFNEKSLAKGVVFTPVVGFIIGIILCGIYFVFQQLNLKILGVIFVIAGEVIVTGALHLDGLADTFDGLFSNRSKQRMLAIMKDSRIGTNGTLILILAVLCKIGAVYSINEDYIFQSLAVMPVLSRLNIVWTSGMSDYARKEKGMGKTIVDNTGYKEIIIATVIAAVICGPIFFLWSLIIIPVSIIFTLLFTYYIKKRIDGITGDTIGAVIELSEIVILLAVLIGVRSY